MRMSSILFQNEDQSVIVLDVPGSIEEGQVHLSDLKAESNNIKRRLVSSKPIDEPFQTPEPNDGIGKFAESLSDLMTKASVGNALEILQYAYTGPWCLPRMVEPDTVTGKEPRKRKRGGSDDVGDSDEDRNGLVQNQERSDARFSGHGEHQKSDKDVSHTQDCDAAEDDRIDETVNICIPPDASYLHGTIAAQRDQLLKLAPTFDLILVDPPWPNRSARRKRNNYNVASTLSDLRQTLSLLPIAAHLAPDGLVAIWITNKPSIVELLTSPRDGLFAEWGLELIDEWTWLKVTTTGEPIVDVESRWRKPWERLLIARRRGSSKTVPGARNKVILSVPDVHSRKPCLRGLFEDAFPDGYRGLEVFARNLTAGWWSWGDEVLKFQAAKYWVDA